MVIEHALRRMSEEVDAETVVVPFPAFFEIALPEGCETQLAKIMNWTSPQRGDEGYNLNDAQLSNIEVLTNKCFKNEKYIFQLTCNVG